jgi:hypothetical protein
MERFSGRTVFPVKPRVSGICDCRFWIADCRLNADLQFKIENRKSPRRPAARQFAILDFKLPIFD